MTIVVGSECDFITSALSSYNSADNIVRLLDAQRRIELDSRRSNMTTLKDLLQTIEDNLWQALAKDFPKFKFRRQNQTIVVSSGDNTAVYINAGEVNKIQAWGVNDYYEALDTVNKIQNKMWNKGAALDRNWKDAWKRLGKQLIVIQSRNCKTTIEPVPGGTSVSPPPTIPMPPNPPGPQLPTYPCPPVPAQASWTANDQRNWAVTGWETSEVLSAISGFTTNRPSINVIDGRELVFYRALNTTPTKIVWLFHGHGGSARSWFTHYEKLKYVKSLVDAGYAVAAFESYNRVNGKWLITANPANNREISGLASAKQFLSAIGVLPATQYAVGFGAGANMAVYSAVAMGFSKVIIHNAVGIKNSIMNSAYTAKTMWNVSSRDSQINNSEANDLYNFVVANKSSVNPQYVVQQDTLVESAIFDAIPNISTPVATAIFNGLLNAAFITSDGLVTNKYINANRDMRENYLQKTIPAIIATAFGADVANYRKYVNDIVEQIKIVFSDHEFSGIVRSVIDGSLELTNSDLAFLGS